MIKIGSTKEPEKPKASKPKASEGGKKEAKEK